MVDLEYQIEILEQKYEQLPLKIKEAISRETYVDYHLNEDFIINAGATIANFKFMDVSHKGIILIEKDAVEYMKPYLVLTYLF